MGLLKTALPRLPSGALLSWLLLGLSGLSLSGALSPEGPGSHSVAEDSFLHADPGAKVVLEENSLMSVERHGLADLRSGAVVRLPSFASLTVSEAHLVLYPKAYIGCPQAQSSPCLSHHSEVSLEAGSELRMATRAAAKLHSKATIKLQGAGELKKESVVEVGERASLESSALLRLERGTAFRLSEASLASLKGKLHLHSGSSLSLGAASSLKTGRRSSLSLYGRLSVAAGASLELGDGVILSLRAAADLASACVVTLDDCAAVPGSQGAFAFCDSLPCE